MRLKAAFHFGPLRLLVKNISLRDCSASVQYETALAAVQEVSQCEEMFSAFGHVTTRIRKIHDRKPEPGMQGTLPVVPKCSGGFPLIMYSRALLTESVMRFLRAESCCYSSILFIRLMFLPPNSHGSSSSSLGLFGTLHQTQTDTCYLFLIHLF